MKNRVITDNEKIATGLIGIESDAKIMNVGDDNLVDSMITTQAQNEYNQAVGDYVEKLDKQQDLLNQYAEQFADTMQGLEMMPLYRYALIKPFEQNPFQQIKREGNIITEVGNMVTFRNSDNGDFEEEESYIGVAMVIEVGPECKYLQVGDVVMYKKESAFPVPFYSQGYHILDEQRVTVVVNEGLHDRLNKK